MADAVELPDKKKFFTYADYRKWEFADGERYELIYGMTYAMAAPNAYHQSILLELGRQIANYLYGKPCKAYPAPYDVRLFYEEDESDDTVVQPDISVICDEKKRGTEGCRGAPDLVIEILSPSNTAIEMERKFNLYRKAGVREYWVVDPENKGIHSYVFREGRIVNRVFGHEGKIPVDIFSGLEIDPKPVFAE
ncbi:MAG: Uma2 family endonuclease [Spirochaetaceae bacterium]|jgi:Uma2 family endonuclease|nr:Uma2 family endonuclease [Spirochaetaceae bacterium]